MRIPGRPRRRYRGPGGRGVAVAALVAVMLAAASTGARAWGWTAHEMISDVAVDALPVALGALYEPHRAFVARHSVDPDRWREEGADLSGLCRPARGIPALEGPESPRHYIDADAIDRWPFREIPRSFDAYRELAGDRLEVWGTAPWAIAAYTGLLSRDMEEAADLRSILCRSAILVHYVQDLSQPLHLTENYNGQLSGQEGVHFRFESDLVDAYAPTLRARLVSRGIRARLLDDPLDAAFRMLIRGHPGVDDVLLADREALEAAPLDEGQRGSESPAYLRELWSRADGLALERLAYGAEMTASYWTTAWEAAGRPDLAEVARRDPGR